MSAPQYGYSQRARVVRAGSVADTWYVEMATLAPGYAYGPLQAAVPGLEPGDRVLVTQVGMTRGDMVIVGKLPPGQPVALPIAIGDVTGLSAALNARATDDELAAETAARVAGDAAEATARTAAIASAIAAEVADRDTAIGDAVGAEAAARAGADTALDGRVSALEGVQAVYELDTDFFPEKVSNMPRLFVSNAQTLGNNIMYGHVFKVRRALSITGVSYLVQTAGVGGTATVGLYVSSTLSASVPQAATAGITLSPVGLRTATFGGVAVPAGGYVWVLLRVDGYSTQPRLGTNQAVVITNDFYESESGYTVSGSRSGALPATLTMTSADGWNENTIARWIGLSGD